MPTGNCKPSLNNFHFKTGVFEMRYFVKPYFPGLHRLDASFGNEVFQMSHFEKPHFPCFGLQKLDQTHL